MAWDWLYNDLDEAERGADVAAVTAIDRVLKAKPAIYRENMSGYSTGFYGVRNCLWFIGCAAFGSGIETERVNEWLVWGHDERPQDARTPEEGLRRARRRRARRRSAISSALSLGGAELLLHVALEHRRRDRLQVAAQRLARPLRDLELDRSGAATARIRLRRTPHTANRLPIGQLYTHMANIRHLYGKTEPRAAALARWVQERLPDKSYSMSWFIYPFLLTELEKSPEPAALGILPHACYFEPMGQVFMRSESGAEDTYCLFTCGGILSQHRHFDAAGIS